MSLPETGKDGQPVLAFETPAQWEAWLEAHHATTPKGVWICYAKKGSGVPSICYAEALDEALCFGWIDGIAKSLDETYYVQKFTPRRARSKWSQKNREHIARLTKGKRMRPAGLAEVKAAKADGRWEEAYASPSKIEVPEDLRAALEANPEAGRFFATLTGSNRYAVLYRLHDAKRPETRAKRLAQFVQMLAEGKTLH